MTKYKQVFEEMLSQNKAVFASFKKIHDQYVENPASFKNELDNKGRGILRIISRYENRLCGKSENCGFGKFSSNLSLKFWEKIRLLFPKIDEVGVN